MSSSEERLREAARQANGVLKGLGAVGMMGAYYNPASLDEDNLDLVIKTNIPETLAPTDARRLGRALYMLGMIAEEARNGTWVPSCDDHPSECLLDE